MKTNKSYVTNTNPLKNVYKGDFLRTIETEKYRSSGGYEGAIGDYRFRFISSNKKNITNHVLNVARDVWRYGEKVFFSIWDDTINQQIIKCEIDRVGIVKMFTRLEDGRWEMKYLKRCKFLN